MNSCLKEFNELRRQKQMLPSAERVEILKWLLSVYAHTVVNVEAGKSHTVNCLK